MGINVQFYNFAKRSNSTKQPTDTPTVISCTLKDRCGLTNPEIALSGYQGGRPSGYSYAYIPDFSRYYFITEWTYYEGLWECSMTCDVLASFKSVIGGSTKYILRAADNSAWNGEVVDNYYPALAGQTTVTNVGADPWNGPCIVMGVIGAGTNTGSMGAVQYYALTPHQAYVLFDFLFGGTEISGNTFMQLIIDSTETILEAVVKREFNPYQYIASAMYFPISVLDAAASNTPVNIKFGYWELPLQAYPVHSSLLASVDSQNIAQPVHPQASTRGTFLNRSKYSEYTLMYEPFGIIPISAESMKNSSHVFTDAYVDLVTGEGALIVDGGTVSGGVRSVKTRLGVYHAQIGVPIQLAQIATNPFKVVASVGKAASAIATDNVLATVGLVSNGLEGLLPQVFTSGNNGSLLPFTMFYPSVVGKFSSIADENLDDAGRPVFAEKQINTLIGYIKCADGDINLAGLESDRNQINAFLTGGFFYE